MILDGTIDMSIHTASERVDTMSKNDTFNGIGLFFDMISTLPLKLARWNVNGAIWYRHTSALQGIGTVKVSWKIYFDN